MILIKCFEILGPGHTTSHKSGAAAVPRIDIVSFPTESTRLRFLSPNNRGVSHSQTSCRERQRESLGFLPACLQRTQRLPSALCEAVICHAITVVILFNIRGVGGFFWGLCVRTHCNKSADISAVSFFSKPLTFQTGTQRFTQNGLLRHKQRRRAGENAEFTCSRHNELQHVDLREFNMQLFNLKYKSAALVLRESWVLQSGNEFSSLLHEEI